nr:relaxase/mobilization nuclease domain-containing protein [uncultured Anaerosporobacter sp.]
MAISKSIPIRAAKSDHVASALGYIMDESKTSSEIYNYQSLTRNTDITDNNLDGAFAYISNPEKTTTSEKAVLVSGFRCNPATAATEFKMISDKYHIAKSEHISEEAVYCKDNKKSYGKRKQAREAYHFIQSFPPDSIDPKLAHHIGMEFGKRLGNEEYQFVCATHCNTTSVHSHLIFNSYNIDSLKKYRDSKAQLHRMRQINDDLSREYGLPVLLNTENNHSKNYAEIIADEEGTSWKETVRNDILNTAKLGSSSWSDYKAIMEESGYQVQENKKSVTYILPDGKKIMDKTLGQEYTKEKLQEYWDKTYENTSGNLNQQIMDELAELYRKRIKKYIDGINIRVYRYTFLGRRRTDLEMLLIFSIKVLFSILGLMKILFSNQEQLNSNPAYKSVEWKIKNLSETLYLLEKLNIRSSSELDAELKQSRTDTSQLHKEVERLTDQKKNHSALVDSVSVVKYLQARMEAMSLNKETLGIPKPDETAIRKNQAILDPITAVQKRNLFLAISDSKNYRLNCKFNEITSNQVTEIIDFLKSPKTHQRPDMVISLEEFERIRKKKMKETIQKRKMGIRTSQENSNKSDNISSELDLKKLLQQYDSDEKALILKYRGALNHLVQFGIDDISLIETKYNDILKTLEEKEQEFKISDERSKQLSQIKSAVSLAGNKQYLYGPFRDILREKDFKDRIEIVEAAEEHNQQEATMYDIMEEQSIGNTR